MRSIRRAAMLAVLALVAAGGLVATAHAVTGVSIGPAGSITQVSLGLISFRETFADVACRMTLTGGLSRTLVSINAVIGEVTRVTWANCVNGELERVENLSWPMTVRSLNHEAPETRSASALNEMVIRFARATFNFSMFGNGFLCTVGGVNSAIYGVPPLTKVSGTMTSYIEGLNTAAEIITAGGEPGCPTRVEVEGRFGALSPTQTLTFL